MATRESFSSAVYRYHLVLVGPVGPVAPSRIGVLAPFTMGSPLTSRGASHPLGCWDPILAGEAEGTTTSLVSPEFSTFPVHNSGSVFPPDRLIKASLEGRKESLLRLG